MHYRTILTAFGLVALLSAPALLSVPARAQETRASAIAKHDAEFAASDTNKDGALSRAEVAKRFDRMKAGKAALNDTQAKGLENLWFSRADRNKDGKVTKAESKALMLSLFDRYDVNGDGKVNGEEAMKARAAARAKTAGPDAGR